jgi:hypothetical protein
MRDSGGRRRDLCSHPPNANRHHLSWVGSGPRHDIERSFHLPAAAWWPRVGAWLRRALLSPPTDAMSSQPYLPFTIRRTVLLDEK